jgi:hypothetical protein
MGIIGAIVYFLFLAASQVVSIRVQPQVVLSGGSVKVTCMVPRNSHNRRLVIQLPEYRTSERELRGEEAPRVVDMMFDHIPCHVEEAVCAVENDTGHIQAARVSIEVRGCY